MRSRAIGQRECLLGQVSERIVFIERRGGGGGVAAGVLILLRELALGVVFAAGVDEAAERVRRGGHDGLPIAVGDALREDAAVGKRHRGAIARARLRGRLHAVDDSRQVGGSLVRLAGGGVVAGCNLQ